LAEPDPNSPHNPLLEKMKARVEQGSRYVWGQEFPTASVLPDGLGVLDTRRGEDYSTYWTNVGAIPEGAQMVTRHKLVDEETDAFMCVDVAEMIRKVLQLKAESAILDVGSGTGSMAIHIAPHVARYACADISVSLLETAKQRLERLLESRASETSIPLLSFHRLERSDLSPFENYSFDAIFFEAVLGHMDREDSYRYMLEAYRVLKPGGRAYFQFFNLLYPAGFTEFDWTAKNLCDGNGRNLVSRTRFHTSSEVRAYVTHIGFEIDESCSQLSDEPPPVLIHMEERALVAVCVKPQERNGS
jgi:SAM-dependent methyltransferase